MPGGFDIFAQAGGGLRAVDEASTITVTNGTLAILFSTVIGAPKVDALEIY